MVTFIRTTWKKNLLVNSLLFYLNGVFAQLAGAVEYINFTSAEGYDPHPNECSRYGIKQSDGEVLVMLELWGM